ncbi:MAG: chemotaxis protein CheW [Polyangiaceae bacterium]|nr:chemotaxis protein CheW [Polyangiaceae bacterium]NUQ77689.1 chemotaxis protein CheW [Polyangiaceae bacterium]
MKDPHEQPQYLTFHVAGEEYAAPILRVKEIIEIGPMTKVPTMPAYVRGVINLRGSVVPVVDLAKKLGLPLTNVTRWSCIIVAEVMIDGDETVVGVLVDAMGQVIELSAKDIERPPAFGTRAGAHLLRGMGKIGNKFVMILDLDATLAQAALLDASDAAMGVVEAGGVDEATPQ